MPQAAVALGAVAIEKHYTVDKTLPGSPDHHLSVDPRDLKRLMMDGIRTIEKAMGRYQKGPGRRGVAGLSLRAAQHRERHSHSERNDDHGATCSPSNVLEPVSTRSSSDVVVGRTASTDIPEDTVVQWSML